MDRLKVGVIGLGVGAQHLAAYETLPECQVAAICDLSEEKLARVASASLVQTTTNPAEVLKDPEIDVVSIASFDDCHFEQVLSALRAGRHVFVEKPMCTSFEQLRTIKQEWSSRPALQLRSNLVLRAAPLYRFVRDSLLEGRFGVLYAFDGDYLYGRLSKITEGWRKDTLDYSVMCGGGIHLVDLMLWLTGQRPSEVTAIGNRISSEGSAFKYNDFAAAMFRFPSGMIGRITANFGSVHPHQHVVRAFGTKASFLYDDRGARLHKTRDPQVGGEAVDLSPVPASKGSLIPEFVASILNEKGAPERVQHEFDVLSVCLAADAALASGVPTRIEYV